MADFADIDPPTFEEALDDMVEAALEDEDVEDIIAALEAKLAELTSEQVEK